MIKYKETVAILLICMAAIACRQTDHRTSKEEKPVLMFRLSIDNTISDEAWAKTYSLLKQHPHCCDEVWFSTGIGIPSIDIHRQHAERLSLAKKELKKLGIVSSVQIQMTIGHGDQLGVSKEWTAKTWTGWTGSTGKEARYCNCPRQPRYLEYMRSMARLYAEIEPRTLWIDDDLRYDNHYPATEGSRIGCWCETCLAAFSAEEGRNWTRESLCQAMDADPILEQRWKTFSIESLKEVARIITEETHAISPNTQMGYQKTFFDADTTIVKVILKTMAEVSGQKVSYRLGGGAYYDMYHPVSQIVKSMDAARFMRILGCPDYVESWCPEVESYPRHYGSRTGQSVLLEGFAALAYGMDAISMFVIDHGEEDANLQAHSMLLPLEEGAETLKEYARANKGTTVVGFRTATDNNVLFELGTLGIPILPGPGKNLGMLNAEEIHAVNMYSQPSTDVQAFRDLLNSRTDIPARCCSPFVGLLIPRVDENGSLATVGLLNSRIDRQGPIRIQLGSMAPGAQEVIWYELRQKPISLHIEHDEDGASFVEIPSIEAWNAGFLKIN